MRFLRQNTATRVTVGPFYDVTDGITPELALTATNEKLDFVVDDGGVPTLVIDTTATASGGSNDLVHITNDNAGFYDLELTAAQTNYVGRAMLSITYATDHLPVFHEFMILPGQVYDSLVLGTDLLDANTVQVNGTSQTARDLGASVLLSSGTGTGQVDLTSGKVKLAATGHAAFTEAYATDGSTATIAELLYEIKAFLTEKNISGTTVTAKKLDGSTTAATYTINSATPPITSITRSG